MHSVNHILLNNNVVIDLATYSLIKKASQQLELLSIASDSEDSSSSDTSHSPDLPRSRRHRKTKRTSSGPNRTTPGQGLAKTDHSEPKSDQRPNERPDLTGPSAITEIEDMALKKIAPPLPSPPLTPSLFPSLGPTIHFPMPNEPCELKHSLSLSLFMFSELCFFPSDTPLPPDLVSQLKWKMSTITPNIIKNCIARVGFTPCTSKEPITKHYIPLALLLRFNFRNPVSSTIAAGLPSKKLINSVLTV